MEECILTQDEINNLNEQTDIVSLVSKYVKLEKQGKNYKGLCPFHNEKTGSFIVSPDKNIFTCFGCHKSGNPLKFIELIENVEFPDALKMLCDFNGVKYEGRKTQENPNSKYYKIMDTAKSFYNKFLLNDKSADKALEYLKSRGITDDIINDFEIGLSPNSYDVLYQVLNDMNYNELDSSDVGLISSNEKGKYHDFFVNRIMFPVKDDRGNVVAFSARKFYNDDPAQPKYINTKETRIYRKNQILFNLNLAKQEINKKHRVILHEGQMDVIASYKSGLKEAVCSLGSAFGDDQAKLLAKYTKSVIIAYDGDDPGVKSAIKAIEVFKRNGFDVHLVLYPDNMDPDEFVLKHGKEKYVEFFENNIIDEVEYLFRVTILNKNLDDKNVLNKVKSDVFNLISSLNSPILEEKYLKRFSDYLKASYEAVYEDYQKQSKNNGNQKVIVKEVDPTKDLNKECELRLIYYATKSKKLALEINEKINNDLDVFSESSLHLWFSLLYNYYEEYDEFDEKLFLNLIPENDFNQYKHLNLVLGKSLNKTFDEEDLNKCIEKIKDMKISLRNKVLRDRILASSDDTERSRNIDEMFKNKRNREKRAHN